MATTADTAGTAGDLLVMVDPQAPMRDIRCPGNVQRPLPCDHVLFSTNAPCGQVVVYCHYCRAKSSLNLGPPPRSGSLRLAWSPSTPQVRYTCKGRGRDGLPCPVLLFSSNAPYGRVVVRCRACGTRQSVYMGGYRRYADGDGVHVAEVVALRPKARHTSRT